ncbi:MAG TPA: S24 family peptidase [Candidatus Eremiobacteraeota bacterium]|nr:MAG: hypothetical protein BWY64_02784 [bacterium ADurb.Bin363]HPZ09007.1 S24 family peptidase [Candidatus Eremiobacteraeota bacterium]
MKVVCNNTITLPSEWNINFDFVITAIGDYMIEYGITPGMLLFIKEQKRYQSGDTIAIICKNWVNPVLKKLKILSTGEMIFYSPRGQIIEKHKDIEILGKVVFKMDNPYKNTSIEEQLDFWN